MKIYRYLIYKLYSWGLNRKNDTPVANVVITLSFVHFIQLFAIYLVLLKFFPRINVFNKVDEVYVGMVWIIICIVNYFLFYNKKRCEKCMEEFKDETPAQRKKGRIFVLLYLIGSIIIFFVLMPFLFGF